MVGGSSSKKSSAQQASSQGAWLGSDVDEGHIEGLHHHRLLPLASQVSVRLPSSETAPAPAAGEVVVFVENFYQGFGLPASSFFALWLQFFGLQPHHLAPNAILQLAAFVVLCEGFVGIEPRGDLWRSLFFFKQHSIAMGKSEKGFFYVKSADPAQDALNMPPFAIAPPTRWNWDAKTPRPHPEVALICAHLDILGKSGLLDRDLLATMVLFKTLQGSLRQPTPDVEVSDASEIEDKGAMEPRSDSSAGSEDHLESEGTEPSAIEEHSGEVEEVTSPQLTHGWRQGGGATAADEAAGKKGKGATASGPASKRPAPGPLAEQRAGGAKRRHGGGRRQVPVVAGEAEDADEDTATAAERASWAAADAAERELEIESKHRWDTAAGKADVGQPHPSRVERPAEKCAKAKHDPSAHARVEEPASEAASRPAQGPKGPIHLNWQPRSRWT
ncbi:hypothetical protein D1007_37634 [Hordeum vulgare]|nr:hypothetical protein D1007_37634 [Hordeum vulgare]